MQSSTYGPKTTEVYNIFPGDYHTNRQTQDARNFVHTQPRRQPLDRERQRPLFANESNPKPWFHPFDSLSDFTLKNILPSRSIRTSSLCNSPSFCRSRNATDHSKNDAIQPNGSIATLFPRMKFHNWR